MINEYLLKKDINNIVNRKNNVYNKQQILKNILSLIDLTTLNGDDDDEKVEQLCKKSISPEKINLGIESTASVCIYPIFVPLAKKILSNTKVKVASVAGGFPAGQIPLSLRIAEVSWAIQNGADEIDMVISRGKLLSGNENYVYNEIVEHKKVCGGRILKVIIETGELKDYEIIKRASEICISGGADFIKTSTGKINPAATLEASWVILNVIKEHYKKTKQKIGFKCAGGISESQDALKYYLLVKNILGEEWMCPDLLRFGASRLFDNIVKEIV
jgi:deoxyribose-phosphate aldolase